MYKAALAVGLLLTSLLAMTFGTVDLAATELAVALASLLLPRSFC
jgi:hypothetical protein